MKEHKEITPIVEQYRALKKAEADMEGAQQLLDDPASDRELRQMAAEELNACLLYTSRVGCVPEGAARRKPGQKRHGSAC